ncbi:MAG: YkgJ family cysteine cluster protein [Clostridia bacterium]|nr:YkgJ family cysteine cluster protein [Clostridia bacterium]
MLIDAERDAENRKILAEIKASTIGMEDTFKFGCKMCGDCCRKRSEPVFVMGYDIYNIAKALDMHPVEALIEYTQCVKGTDSHLPTVFLKERLDGSCRLLRNGKCTIQSEKPVVCRVFPLGRYIDGEKIHYFSQQNCTGKGEEIKLKDWIDTFNLSEMDEVSIVWSKLVGSAALYMRTLDRKPQKAEEFFKACFHVFYCDYDMSKPAVDSLREGAKRLEKEFKGFKVNL